MNWIAKLCLVFCLIGLPLAGLQAQVIFKGKVSDKETSKPVAGAIVSITALPSEAVLAFTQTDEQGEFILEYKQAPRIIALNIRHLSYAKFQQSVVLASAQAKPITIEALLVPQALQLNQVEIKAPSPIIVKKDTIIYDISHWQQVGDESLEAVLQKIPGFKVLPSGELEFEGRPIAKVLVDGKEFSNVGAAILTKSLDPNRIKNLEVRTKEQSRKLKNSLLDTKHLMVLDIKLKEELDQSFFGRARATAGWQRGAVVGGQVNLFSFGRRRGTHFFAERDLLGNSDISIYQIQNLGSDAAKKMFEIPADFAEFVAREEYNQEIYGFKDYTLNHQHTAGLTNKFTLSPKNDLFLGSYTSYRQLGYDLTTEWIFPQTGFGSRFLQQQASADFESNNKAEWRHDSEKLKAVIDLNLTLARRTRQHFNQENTQGLTYDFQRAENSVSFHPNALVEYEVNPKLGLQAKLSYGLHNQALNTYLAHNDPAYARFLRDERGNLISSFNQRVGQQSQLLMAQAKAQYQTKLGQWSSGVQFVYQQLGGEKNAFRTDSLGEASWLPRSIFTGRFSALSYHKVQPYVAYALSLGQFRFKQQWGLSAMAFPDTNGVQRTERLPEFNLSVQFDGFVIASLGFKQGISAFPLSALLFGYDLRDFRQFTLTRQLNFVPQAERVIDVSLDKQFTGANLLLSFMGAYGITFKGEQFLLGAQPFVASFYNQLPATYYMAEFAAKKHFAKSPLQIELIQSIIRQEAENVDETNNRSYQLTTTRHFTELNFTYKSPRSRWGGVMKNKYSNFVFASGLSPTETVQNMFSTTLTFFAELLREKLTLEPGVRYVQFGGAQQANFINLTCALRYHTERVSVFVEGDNLLNAQSFVKQDLQPLILVTSQQAVFGRYLRAGVSWKFN
ncbi:MAG: carboxypeptidase-like regulatory domain-containing protein [Bernardetiaceae bacterium]|nr:carboxypeptidase-like regulatory domain-containing protein [Bernardetiaceae bacterium]